MNDTLHYDVCACGHPRVEHGETGCLGNVIVQNPDSLNFPTEICVCAGFDLWYHESPPDGQPRAASVAHQETPSVPVGHTGPANPVQAVSGDPGARNEASRRGRANGERGKRAERDLVVWLRAHGWPGAERTVRTGYRTRTRGCSDHGDIDGTLGITWQVKDVAERDHYLLPTWLADTERQRVASGADLGILVVKRRGHADPGQWWAHLPLADLIHDALTSSIDIYPEDLYMVPVRLTVADLAPILAHAGYGSGVDS